MRHGTIMESDLLFGGFNWPSAARLADGRIAVVASGFRLAHVCPFGKVAIFYSSDGGETWTPPAVILDTPLDDRDAGIAVSGKRVLVTSFNNSRAFQRRLAARDRTPLEQALIGAYCDMVSDEEEEAYLGATCVLSEDGGNTFGKVFRLPVSSPHGPCVREDGSFYYLGKAFSMEDESGKFPVDRLLSIESADGAHWTQPTEHAMPQREGTLFCEPHALSLGGGRMLAGLRAQDDKGLFTVYTATGEDGGRTYGAWRQTGIEGSPPHFMRHSGGAVVLTYGRRIPPYGQRARVSYDGGESWGEEIVLRDEGLNWDLGYPATCECGDGSLLTVYYQRRKGARHTGIAYTKWNLPERQ